MLRSHLDLRDIAALLDDGHEPVAAEIARKRSGIIAVDTYDNKEFPST